jgi:hypothetical protein
MPTKRYDSIQVSMHISCNMQDAKVLCWTYACIQVLNIKFDLISRMLGQNYDIAMSAWDIK